MFKNYLVTFQKILVPHPDPVFLVSFTKHKFLYEGSRDKIMDIKIISGLELVGVRAKMKSPPHLIREIMRYSHSFMYAHDCLLAVIPVLMVYECL